MDDINKYTDDNPIKLVVGNKSDLADQRQVSQVDINKFKQQTGIPVMEASAKNSDKIYDVMETITRMLIAKKTKMGNNYNSENSNSSTDDENRIKINDKKFVTGEQSQDCCSFS